MKKIALVALLLLSVSLNAVAEETEEIVYETKMVLVEGKKSYLMGGDPFKRNLNKPLNYSRSKVLPSLVLLGWQITSVQLNEDCAKKEACGYALLKRKIETKK